jgi:hypothetical protein
MWRVFRHAQGGLNDLYHVVADAPVDVGGVLLCDTDDTVDNLSIGGLGSIKAVEKIYSPLLRAATDYPYVKMVFFSLRLDLFGNFDNLTFQMIGESQ